ncbi:uncharacterized protein LOC111325770 [Stylophora pistillata]|nr:uncharacterized protein LOC111325770 [Stylophora pistillata]
MRPGVRFQNRGSRSFIVSGCYKVFKNGALPPQPILIEHCCLVAEGNSWDILVKCRPHSNQRKKKRNWRNVMEVYPDAKVERCHNDIELTLPVLRKNLEVAAFGVPRKDDQKRMQMTIFGKEPTQGCDWKIRVYLIDDSAMAFKAVCKKEAEKGNRLLTTLSGLFVSNSKESITIEFTDMDPGWQIKGNNVKAISTRDAWNSPENSANFPLCVFDVSHVDRTKQQFFCEITVTHDHDSANTEMVAFFEQKRGLGIKQPKKHKNAPMKPPHGKTSQLKYIFRCLGPTLNRGSRDAFKDPVLT